MKTKNFAILIISIGLILGLLIYWREYTTRDQVILFHVLLWQLVIWSPWIIGYMLLDRLIQKTNNTKFATLSILSFGIIWLGLHFGWFFFISSTLSPYLGKPGSRFGVYRYFFIFWSLIDLALIWFIIDNLKRIKKEELPLPILFELTRGGNRYLCKPQQIQLLTAENYYTRLYTSQGIFLMRKPLKFFYNALPRDVFMKVHRSTVINVNYVMKLTRGNDNGLEIIMKNGTKRKVSRNFSKEVKLFFKDRTY